MKLRIGLLVSFLILTACSPFRGNQAILKAENFVQVCDTMSEPACRAMYWVNFYRIINHLQPLENNEACTQGAEFHAQDMVQFGYFSHDGRNETWEERYLRFNVPGDFAENIAEGMDPQDVVVGWMNSPGHRANILDPELRSGGMGVTNNTFVNCFSTSVQNDDS